MTCCWRGLPRQPLSIAGVSKKDSLGCAHASSAPPRHAVSQVARIIEAKRLATFMLRNVRTSSRTTKATRAMLPWKRFARTSSTMCATGSSTASFSCRSTASASVSWASREDRLYGGRPVAAHKWPAAGRHPPSRRRQRARRSALQQAPEGIESWKYEGEAGLGWRGRTSDHLYVTSLIAQDPSAELVVPSQQEPSVPTLLPAVTL